MSPLLPGPTFCPACLPRGLGHLRVTLCHFLLSTWLGGSGSYGISGNPHCVLHTEPKRVNPQCVWVLSESQPSWDQKAFVRGPGRAHELRSYCCWSLVARCSIWSDQRHQISCVVLYTPLAFRFPQTKNNHAHLANAIPGPSCGVDYRYPAEPWEEGKPYLILSALNHLAGVQNTNTGFPETLSRREGIV